MVNEKFVIDLQGKKFVTFEGLLDEFHKGGGKEISTEIVNKDPLIIQATAKGTKGTFQGIGDASDENVNSMIQKHKIRMAETRAIARALRWYTNIGMCSAEELGGEAKPSPKSSFKYQCRNKKCGKEITQKVQEYSLKKQGVPLCMDCQKTYNEDQYHKDE